MRLFGKTFSRREMVRVAVPIAVLALIASVVTGRERPSAAVVEPAARINARVEAKQPDAKEQELDLSQLVRPAQDEGGQPGANPFARRSFAPNAAPQAAQAAAPEAPPLPFRYVGKMIEDGKLAVFLSRGEDSYSVHAGQKRGQKIDEQYRVDKVTETSVTFTYLPLKTKQTLDIPAVN
jgi:hypothetical protein